ncbi:hypothetical protein BX666DRAFT_1213188 [Dichotomocladium elegans]|nr:hypothetical protein BX666DRAFT_1213188 [Dichotomocladium elegans]
MEDNNTPDVPMPCTAGCGFYGNKIYNNMCSKCFREQEAQNKQAATSSETNSLAPENDNVSQQQQQQPPSTAATAAPSPAQDEQPQRPVQKNKGRCFSCRTKIPLAKQLSNKCRCEYVFCDSHRYPDKHDCDFDHASMDKDLLAKKNPKLNERPRGGRSFQRLDSL